MSRTESSRCRAVFHSRVISGRHPFARPALPGVTARMGGSDFHASPPASSLLHLFAGARLNGPMRGSPWLPRILNVKLDTAWDPGEYQRRSPSRSAGCCLPEGQTRRHSPTKIFGAQHLQGRLHPLPLHLACFRAYASTRLLPAVPQGSILGSRLTITQAGFSPARTRGLARPHCPRFLPDG